MSSLKEEGYKAKLQSMSQMSYPPTRYRKQTENGSKGQRQMLTFDHPVNFKQCLSLCS